MSKQLTFVYEWIGPNGPMSNTRMPNVADMSWSLYRNDQPVSDYVHHPFIFNSFDSANIVSPSNMPNGKFFYELDFSNIFYRHWRHFFDLNHGALSNNFVSPQVMDRIKDGNGYLLITVLFEAWVHDEFFNTMHVFLDHHEIPCNKVVYMTNCANGQEIYLDYAKRNNKTDRINVEYFPSFRAHRTDIELVLEKYVDIPYNIENKNKTFLCFQRRFNDQRIAVLLEAVKQQYISSFYMSMNNEHPEHNKPFSYYANGFISKHPSLNFDQDLVEAAQNILPLTLDTANFSSYPMESTQFSTEQYYRDSLINIINETYFFDKRIHLTEKTWKPIAFKQPFIIIGATGSLQHMKDLGFKTFDHFWDESYDQEKNDLRRLQKIFEVFKSIVQWSDKNKKRFMKNAKSVVEYNFNHLYNLKDPEISILESRYGN